MKCPKCGSFIPDDSRFCNYCGEKLKRNTVSDIPASTKRPRDENFDVEIKHVQQQEEDEAASARPKKWVILTIVMSGVVFALVSMTLYSVLKKNQHIIINPTTASETEPPETLPTETQPLDTTAEPTTEEPTEIPTTEEPTTEEPTTTEPAPEYTDLDRDGLVFRLYESENRAVLLRCFNAENIIHLPAEVEGLPLTELGPEAFTDSDAICYISIPENVFAIHNGCFANCSNLREIVLPDSLIFCDRSVFTDTTGFTIISHTDTRGYQVALEIGEKWEEGDSLSVD